MVKMIMENIVFLLLLYYKIIVYYIVHQQGLLPKLHVFLSKKKH